MDTIVGRGGNQAVDLSRAGVPGAGCRISKKENGQYDVTPLNVAPIFVDGQRIYEFHEEFGGDSEICLGNWTGTIEELYKRTDFTTILDWGMMAERLPDADAARMFNNVTVDEYAEDEREATYLWNNAAAVQAYYLIKNGKLRKAQELLYEAGDELYEAQDGSVRLKTAYASLLVLLAWLYVKADRKDVADRALQGANLLIKSGATCSKKVTDLLNNL